MGVLVSPPKQGAARGAVEVSNHMQASGHLSFFRGTQSDVDGACEEVGGAVARVETLGVGGRVNKGEGGGVVFHE